MIDSRITDSLDANEPGDARSYLDELDPNGQSCIETLNKRNESYLWSFDDDGWGYDERDEV
ncbi:hypothetical protein AB6D11_02590 [Vibrio splendidus]